MVFNQRSVKDKDLVYLSRSLREADKREVEAYLGGNFYFDAIFESYKASDVCRVIVNENDIPLMIWGLNNDGKMWALGTDEIDKRKKTFLKTIKHYFLELIEWHNEPITLYNHVDERNKTHIDFLKYLGFTVTNMYEVRDRVRAYYFFMEI